MREATRVEEVRSAVETSRSEGKTVGFVPTMGFLHEGHLSLIRIARERGDFVVISIFVNPVQFGPNEDYESYPRDLDRDRELAASVGTDLLFRPDIEELYPEGFCTEVRVRGISEPLCGARRPGHFDGVALVVTKLLEIVRPDFSVFGQKDAQQAILIRRLVRDLHLPGKIVVGPIVREDDGLAMSSRNRYLSPEDRGAAVALSRGLFLAERAHSEGERSSDALTGIVRREIEGQPRLRLEYIEIRDPETLEPWPRGEGPALLAGAIHVGSARLIDNVILGDFDGVAPAVASTSLRNPTRKEGT